MTALLLLVGLGVLALWAGWFGGGRLLNRRSELLRDFKTDGWMPPRTVRVGRYSQIVQLVTAVVVAVLVSLPGLSRGQVPLVAPLFSAVCGWFMSAAVRKVLAYRRRIAMDQAVSDLIGHLRVQAAVNIPLLQALESAPPVVREPLRSEIEELVADARLAPLPSALERFVARTRNARIQELVEHLRHQRSLGVPLARVFTEEEQHQLTLMKEAVRQRIRTATVTMSIVTFLLFLNGAIVFMTPLAIRAMEFLAH
ncbi:MAG TPA: hypothetical protein VGK74_17240 [Symbiobacteriaceae bacterium]